MKKVIIVQARMASTRLPGKVMMTVLGKPLLEYQIERLCRVRFTDRLVIATTDNGAEAPIAEICRRLSINCLRGPEDDVLTRYHMAAHAMSADVVIRITSDCPIIDPVVVDQVISFFDVHKNKYDYVTNALIRSFPRGMDTEVFPLSVLDEAYNEATDPAEREHVTPFIYNHPERYRIGHVVRDVNVSNHRWTVDTPEDFELIRRIIHTLYPLKSDFTMEDVLALLERFPDWVSLNSAIKQKKAGE